MLSIRKYPVLTANALSRAPAFILSINGFGSLRERMCLIVQLGQVARLIVHHY